MWATTVKQALAEGSTKLRLHASEELLCTNMMCDRVGASCLCKLSMALERLRDLRHLDQRASIAEGSTGHGVRFDAVLRLLDIMQFIAQP